jgi:hypothetical protein
MHISNSHEISLPRSSKRLLRSASHGGSYL